MESTSEDKEKEMQSMVEDYASYGLERKNKIEQLSSLLVFVYKSQIFCFEVHANVAKHFFMLLKEHQKL